jgi:hypothetical protein
MIIVRKKRLKSGTSNRGIIHQKGVWLHCGVLFFDRIEKRTTSAVEIEIAQHIARAEDFVADVFPRIYNVCSRKRFSSIFMEFLPGAGQYDISNASRSDMHRLTNNLANALDVFSGIGDRYHRTIAPENLLTFSGQVEVLPKEYINGIRHMHDSVQMKGLDKILVFSHGDLHFHNMHLGEDLSVRLMDWALASWNLVGADLHHFYNLGLKKGGRYQIFFDDLVPVYAKKFEVTEEEVRLGACYYATKRHLRRSLSRGFRKGSEKKLSTLIEAFKLISR